MLNLSFCCCRIPCIVCRHRREKELAISAFWLAHFLHVDLFQLRLLFALRHQRTSSFITCRHFRYTLFYSKSPTFIIPSELGVVVFVSKWGMISSCDLKKIVSYGRAVCDVPSSMTADANNILWMQHQHQHGITMLNATFIAMCLLWLPTCFQKKLLSQQLLLPPLTSHNFSFSDNPLSLFLLFSEKAIVNK